MIDGIYKVTVSGLWREYFSQHFKFIPCKIAGLFLLFFGMLTCLEELPFFLSVEAAKLS